MTTIKERPILFSTDMVQALLNGTKTQTRRIIKPPKGIYAQALLFTKGKMKCPYGKIGDLLWVRETWARPFLVDADDKEYFSYKADEGVNTKTDSLGYKWKPSIHMPKAACRIWLEITDIRVERLQDISEDDAKAEGAPLIEVSAVCHDEIFNSYKYGFINIWNSIHEAFSHTGWNTNPWVWVIEFKRVQKGGSNA